MYNLKQVERGREEAGVEGRREPTRIMRNAVVPRDSENL